MQTASARAAPWAAVVGLSIDQLVAWGALYYSYGVLAVPIARDLGVTTSTVAAAFSISLLLSSLLARRVGPVMDQIGARPVLLYGSVLGPLALGGLATVQGEISLFFVFAGLGIAQAFCLYEPAFRAVVEWFPAARQRGRALLLLTAVAGFASTAFLPFTALLLNRFGWRTAVLLLAAITVVVTLPIRLRLPRSAARAPQHQSRSTFVQGTSFGRLLSAGFALQAFAATGATVCLVWHLVERGEALEAAAALAGLAGAAQVPGRLLLSPLSNVLPTEIRLPLLLVIQGGALIGISLLTGPPLVVAVMTFGAAAGVMTLERAAVVIEWFGPESFGARSGQLASSSLLARAAAPFAIELVRGRLGYARALGVLAICLLFGSVLLVGAARARRRSRPEPAFDAGRRPLNTRAFAATPE
jgi:MFS family permease